MKNKSSKTFIHDINLPLFSLNNCPIQYVAAYFPSPPHLPSSSIKISGSRDLHAQKYVQTAGIHCLPAIEMHKLIA